MSDAAERLRAVLEGPDMAFGGPAHFRTEDLREVLKENSRQAAALTECHKEISKLRDALLNNAIEH